MYGFLPNTGMNLSTPIYALIGLVMVIVGGITTLVSKLKNS